MVVQRSIDVLFGFNSLSMSASASQVHYQAGNPVRIYSLSVGIINQTAYSNHWLTTSPVNDFQAFYSDNQHGMHTALSNYNRFGIHFPFTSWSSSGTFMQVSASGSTVKCINPSRMSTRNNIHPGWDGYWYGIGGHLNETLMISNRSTTATVVLAWLSIFGAIKPSAETVWVWPPQCYCASLFHAQRCRNHAAIGGTVIKSMNEKIIWSIETFGISWRPICLLKKRIRSS